MTIKRFAEGTEVPVTKTRDELERLLTQHGAAQIRIERDMTDGRASVTFSFAKPQRMVRLDIRVDTSTVPETGQRPWNNESAKFPQGWGSWTIERQRNWRKERIEQLEREAWRRLLLVVRAKLELVAGGDTTIEREFLADIMTANGGTVYEGIARIIEHQYQTGEMTPLLLGGRT